MQPELVLSLQVVTIDMVEVHLETEGGVNPSPLHVVFSMSDQVLRIAPLFPLHVSEREEGEPLTPWP